jgi:hypothetical protein
VANIVNVKYKIYKVLFDLLRFRLKYSDLKKIREVAGLYQEVVRDRKPISLGHIQAIAKYRLDDLKMLIAFHNNYVCDSSMQISLDNLKPILDAAALKSKLFGWVNREPG